MTEPTMWIELDIPGKLKRNVRLHLTSADLELSKTELFERYLSPALGQLIPTPKERKQMAKWGESA